jgi:single-strand DNA-binding protein
MSRDINHVTVSGRVAQEVQLRETPEGKPVADFKLVSNRKQLPKDDPERIRNAVFVKITLWNDDAVYWSEQLQKGDEVLVEGQLFQDDFQPKGSEQRTSGRIRLDNVNVKLLKRARKNEKIEEGQEEEV